MTNKNLKNLEYLEDYKSDSELIYLVDHVISPNSKDEITKVGAIITSDDNIIKMWGYNGFPRGINDNVPERQERPEKYFWIEHAERNAIYNCAREGISTVGKSIAVSFMPCMDCARGIVQSGIKKVITLEPDYTLERDLRWKEHIERAKQLFKEAGIELVYINKDLISEHVKEAETKKTIGRIVKKKS